MRSKKLILLAILILPWLTTPMVGVNALRRYSFAALIVNIFASLGNHLARKWRWWKFHVKLHPSLSDEEPFLWGPFFFSSIWALKGSAGKLSRYIVLTLSIDACLAFIFVRVVERLGIFSLKRINHFHFYLFLLFHGYLLYLVQSFQGKIGKLN